MDSKPAKILIVEDEPDHLHLLHGMLASAGYEVVAAYGAEPALRKARDHQPDLILTDLAMPQVSGVHFIAAVKGDSVTAHIPIVAVTAYIWDTIAGAARQAGCDGFLQKPFKKEDLLREVEKHLRSAPSAGKLRPRR